MQDAWLHFAPPGPCPVDLICCARGGQSEMVPRVGSHSTERSS